MFRLVILNSSSKRFNEVVFNAIAMGGTYDGNAVTLEFEDVLTAYEKLFPLFRLNILKWVGTKAYYNNHPVHPYRFVFLQHLRKKELLREVLQECGKDGWSNIETLLKSRFEYYKRVNNVFYFRSNQHTFTVSLSGQSFIDFIDEYNIGDFVRL